MIVPMKKLQILALSKGKRNLTKELRNLGTLHIEIHNAESADLDQLKEDEALVTRAFMSIPDGSGTGVTGNESELSLETLRNTAHEVLTLAAEIKEREDEAERLRRELNRIREWGSIDPQQIAELEESGVRLFPAAVSKDQLAKLPAELPYIRLASGKDRTLLIFLKDPQNPEIELLRLPDEPSSRMADRLEELTGLIRDSRKKLEGMQAEKRLLEKGLQLLQREKEFFGVEASLSDIEELPKICRIEGYIPVPRLDGLRAFVRDKGLGVVLSDPGPDDQVPTLTENPRAVRIIRPVFQFMGTTPGYREQDISLWFLAFFTIFFAMIIGDAGYGMILLAASLFLGFKDKSKNGRVSDGLLLFTLLSFATVVWGAVTGNWFGYGPIADLPVLRNLVIPSLDSFAVENSQQVTWTIQLICFVIALVHLVLAHSLAFLRKIKESPRIHAFADLGWLTAIFGLFFLVLNVVISTEKYPVPEWAIYLIGGGIGVVFLFAGQEGDGFFKGVVRALGDFINIALSGVSAFADVISYIRLFAVGLASIEIAKSFNDMAVGMMEGGTGGIVAGVFVLLLGHTLNLVMGALSVVVHGIRLKMLEFSSHIGNEWAGFEYRPFKN